MNRKQLRKELKELIIPVMENIQKLGTAEFMQAMDINHNGETIQVQFHGDKSGLTVYLMYWHTFTPAFKVTAQQIVGSYNLGTSWLADEFVKVNEHLIGKVLKAKKAVH